MIEYNTLNDFHESVKFDLQDFPINYQSSCNTSVRRIISSIITYIEYKRIQKEQ